jgi:hypothetical protein
MATTRRAASSSAKIEPDTQLNEVSSLELLELFHRKAILEIVLVETEPSRYRLQALISWRPGRWTLMGTRGPRTFRSLDTLAIHLKTIGIGRTITRIELLS